MKTTNTASMGAAKTATKSAAKTTGNSTSKVKEPKFVGMGVGFIKTRMAAWKVEKIADAMEEIADSIDVEVIDVIVDRSGSRDIDRKAIDDIYEWLDNAPVHVLIVESLTDITDDEDDFKTFMQDMDNRDIIIICLKGGKVIMPSSAGDNDDDDDEDDNE